MRDSFIRDTLVRSVLLLTGLLCLLATAQWQSERRPLWQVIAQQMQGESWFQIQLYDTQVGYMYSVAKRSARGDWRFETTTHFLLGANTANTITRTLIFAADGDLRKASYENREGRALHRVTIAPDADGGLIADLHRRASPVELDWHYALADHLALETWLKQRAPDAGATRAVANIDFERLALTRRAYRVVEENETGYLVELNAPIAATRTQLNQSFRPQALTMAQVFHIQPASKEHALALSGIRGKVQYRFDVEPPIVDHTRVKGLRLELSPPLPQVLDTPFYSKAGRTLPRQDPQRFIGEEMRLPLSHPRIQSLVLKAQTQAQGDMLTALTELAHRQMEYAENEHASTVIEALQRGYGECTDFADLLTSMARAAGLPARTVFGLAYQSGQRPGLMFHAWSEVFYENRWQALDPTWNQRVTDATHIPLTESQFARLMLAHTRDPVRVVVSEIEYF